MDTAVSSGVRACTSRPMGECKRVSCSSVTPASRSLAMRSSCVRLLPIAPTYPAGVRSATWSSGTSNFGSWVSTQIAVRASTGISSILVRPADHHLVGVGKALGRGEDPACVAHRHVISEELGNPRDSRREVDGAEYQHPRRRREGLHEDGYLIHPALPVETVVPLTGAALRQHSPGIVIDRVVQSVRSE